MATSKATGEGESTGNPEYDAIKRSYPVLVECISQDPRVIHDWMIPLGILSSKDERYLRNPAHDDSDKARAIVDVIMDQVKRDHSLYEKFVAILKGQP